MVRGNIRVRVRGGLAASVIAATALLTAPSAAAAPPAAAPVVLLAAESPNTPVSYQGFSYPSTVTAPTADKPQSKLWYAGGAWWGLLIGSASGTVDIHRLRASDHAWVDTGVVTDTRPTSTADALYTGGKLYTASRTTSGSARINRFTYAAGTDTWSQDAGYPVTLTSTGARSMTLALDSTGTLWATYAKASAIYVAHSTTGANVWSTPVAVPVSDSTVDVDDISAVIAFAGKVGIFWSDQQSNAVRFAVHVDGAPDTTWTLETVASGTGIADNHMNLKTLVNDAQGRVFAVVKTSYGDLGEPATSPLITVLSRSSAGVWTSATAGTVADKLTRPQIALDETNNRIYVMMTGPTSGGTIYYKASPLNALSFSAGRGDVFMSWSGAVLNNVSTMRDPVNSTTNLVAVASDDANKRYYHAELKIDAAGGGGDTTAPSNPSGVTATATSPTSVTLGWTASTDSVGVTSYRVYRNGSVIGTSPTPGYVDSTAAPSTTYTYGVDALDAANNHSAVVNAAPVTTPPPVVGGAVAFRAGSTAQVGNGAALVVAKPAGLTVGDVMLATVSSRGNPTISAPAGWTLVTTTTNSTTMRQAVYWRAAGASEPATWTFTLSQAKAAVVQIAAYSGVSTTAPVRAFAASVNASSTTVTAPALTANSGDGVVAVFGTARSSNLTPVSSLTKRTQISSVGGSNFVSGAVGDRAAAVTGSTGTFTATTSGSAASVGHTVVLAPA